MNSKQPQLQKLLVRASALADAGELTGAREIYRDVCKLQPDNDEAWFMDGSLSLDLGDVEQAITGIDRALAINDLHPGALYLKASLERDAGIALDLCQRSINADPDFPDVWALQGRLQKAVGKYTEACESSERAFSLDPGLTSALLTKAHALQSLGRLPEAVEAYQSVTSISPDRMDVYCATGRLLMQLNRYKDAEASFNLALQLNPGSADAHEGLGTVCHNAGRNESAEYHLRQAIQYGPALLDARRLLGTVLRGKGDLQGALEHWGHVVLSRPEDEPSQVNLCLLKWELGDIFGALSGCLDILEKNPNHLPVRQIFPNLLDEKPCQPELLERVRAEIIHSFSVNGLDCETLFLPSLRILQLDSGLNSSFECLANEDLVEIENAILSGRFSALFRDELFLNILCNATVCDVALEKQLTRLREACLGMVGKKDVHQASLPYSDYPFLASLACQCFHTEYSYAVTPDQEEKLERLENAISSSWQETGTLEGPDVLNVVVYAMYRPLHNLEFIDSIVERLCSIDGEPLCLLVKRQVGDFMEELRIKSRLPSLTPIKASLSREIEVEYDESPYPRWLSTGIYSPEPYRRLFHNRYPAFDDPGVTPQPLKVLVAGCGTGRHAIVAASQFADAEVLAIDLSASSLAYGQRMADEMGVVNISFQQADILELRSVRQKFHIIEAGGVLHNMESPCETIKLFSDLLEDKGLLYVSTYRKAARNKVLMARKYIRERDRSKTSDGIRQARQDIIALADTDHSFRGLIRSRDFFTLDEARFLLFDVHEHTFDVDELYAMLEESQLRMVGFELATSRDLHRYRLLNPDDLSVANQTRVREFELKYPAAFAGKYEFWCQKM